MSIEKTYKFKAFPNLLQEVFISDDYHNKRDPKRSPKAESSVVKTQMRITQYCYARVRTINSSSSLRCMMSAYASASSLESVLNSMEGVILLEYTRATKYFFIFLQFLVVDVYSWFSLILRY